MANQTIPIYLKYWRTKMQSLIKSINARLRSVGVQIPTNEQPSHPAMGPLLALSCDTNHVSMNLKTACRTVIRGYAVKDGALHIDTDKGDFVFKNNTLTRR